VIRRRTEQELRQAQAVLREQISDDGPGGQEPTLLNLQAALQPHETGYVELELRYRTRRFRVPPVPWRDGLRMLVLDRHIARLNKTLTTDAASVARLVELEYVMLRMVETWKRLVRPMGWWDRLTWRWQGNPFEDVNPFEFRALRDFFCDARMRCRVRVASSIRAAGRPTSIWRTSWRGLSGRFPVGAVETVSPAAGGTTGSA
jgi:hypothetical protein